MLHSIGTVLAFLAFIAICIWAYSPSKKKQFDDAAQLPFDEEFPAPQPKPADTKAGNGDD
jgi:cytochrome c oxidase cbb3-type subunit 4